MPRKSNASVAPAESTAEHDLQDQVVKGGRQSLGKDADTIGIDVCPKPCLVSQYSYLTLLQDLLLPRTLVQRLAKGVLPPNTSVSKDALLALTKAASVFVSHIASTADERTVKKTIAPQDVVGAIKECEFDMFALRVEQELTLWEEVVRGKRRGYREKVKARESGQGVRQEDEDGERELKRRKRETGEDDHEGGASEHTHNGGSPRGRGDTDGGDDTLQDDELDDPIQEDDQQEPDAQDTEPDDEDDDEDETRDEADSYGPDDQLRHDMNGEAGGTSGDDSD